MTDSTEAAGPSSYAELGMSMGELQDMSAPQPKYQRIIEEGGVMAPMEGLTLTFSRQLTEYVLRHHELFSSANKLELGNVRPLIPINTDPPGHAKYRRLLDPLFAPKRMEAQDADITARANRLIESFVDHGECNFSEEFAELFPTSVFLGLMGLPEDDLPTFLRLRDGILRTHTVDERALADPELCLQIQHAVGQEIYDFFGRALDERERRPTDDILTHFLNAEIAGERLSREEILDICFLFLIAGLDTVSDSLTCMFAFLATHPRHRHQIVDHPDIIPGAVEELLRWESPVAWGTPRVATQDAELPNGQKVAAGTTVVVNYGAANVDPAEYPDAMQVRFDREVNRHITFGGGVHRCLGSNLARRELRITLREWHRRIPEYRLKPGHEELVYPPGLRSVKDLTLTWD